MSFFTDLLENPTVAGIRATVVGYAEAADLAITSWLSGGVGEQMVQAVTLAAYSSANVAARAIRGFASLDTSVDPGDDDPYDPGNVDLDEVSGNLSAFGENTFGTTRGEKTFANGPALFDNSLGVIARTFAPEALTWTWTGGTPPSPAPTYRNAADPTIYTNPDGTVTVNAGATLEIPIVAEEIGTRSNVPSTGLLSLTTSMVGVTSSNSAPILGSDRENADLYRARCRQAPARISLAGPVDIYSYLATKNLDGTPLLNADGDEVGITRLYVTEESATGNVDVYYADADGVPLAADVTAANLNIATYSYAVPGTRTFGPDLTGGRAAIAVPIAIVGTGKIKRRAGVSDAALKAAAEGEMAIALGLAFRDFPVGGVDQVLGAGVIYTTDLRAIAADAYAGLYNVLVSTPAGASTAVALGRVATLASATFTVTVVP